MKLVIALLISVSVFTADQASKYFVLEAFRVRDVFFIEVTPFLNFALGFNRGVNFGLFASESAWQPYILAGVAVSVSAALLVWAARTSSMVIAVGCGAAIGGALGNALDRVLVGAVVDFLNFDCCGVNNPYAFNIADVGVFLGAVLIAWSASGAPDDAAKAPERSRPPGDTGA
ncbi:MAG: signal peptidase II [Pseudomonadota bacterium]